MLYLLIHKTYPTSLVILLPSATGLVNFFVGFDKTGHFIEGSKNLIQWLLPNDNPDELLQKYLAKQLELTVKQYSPSQTSETLNRFNLQPEDLEGQIAIPFSTSQWTIPLTLRTDDQQQSRLKTIPLSASQIMWAINNLDNPQDGDHEVDTVKVYVSGSKGEYFNPILLSTLTLLAAAAVTSNYLSVVVMLQRFCDFEFLKPIGGMRIWAYAISLFSAVAPFSINEEVVLDWSNGISRSILGADYSFQFEGSAISSTEPTSCCSNKPGIFLLYTLIYVCTILQGIQGEVYTRNSAGGSSSPFMEASLLTLGLVTMLFMIVTKLGAMEAFVLEKAGVLPKEKKEQQKQSKLLTERITMSVNMLITIMKLSNELTKDPGHDPLFNIQCELKGLTDYDRTEHTTPSAMYMQINLRLGLYYATLNGIKQLKQSQQPVSGIRQQIAGLIANGILNETQTESSITSALYILPQDQNGHQPLGEEETKGSIS